MVEKKQCIAEGCYGESVFFEVYPYRGHGLILLGMMSFHIVLFFASRGAAKEAAGLCAFVMAFVTIFLLGNTKKISICKRCRMQLPER